MVFKRETLQSYLKSQKLPEDTTEIIMPVFSTCSAFRFESQGPTVSLSGRMNLEDDYYNLSLVDNNFDVVLSASGPGLYTADVTALTYIKLTISGDPSKVIYAFVE